MLDTSDNNFGPEFPCLDIMDDPGHLNSSYLRLALVTREEHLHQLDLSRSDTLIVSCDWLLWQQASSRGHHCVYYELGIVDWNRPDGLHTDLLVRANDWVYAGGRDLTLFKGVSLGKQFSREMGMIMVNSLRLEHSLKGLVDRFNPRDIIFFDYADELNFLGSALRKKIVNAFCEKMGLAFFDRSDETRREAGQMAELQSDSRRPWTVRFGLVAYSAVLQFVTYIRNVFSASKPRVLVLVNTNIAEPLVGNFKRKDLVPVFVGRTIPKKPSVLWHCLLRSVYLPTPWPANLNEDDFRRIDEIRHTVAESLQTTETPANSFVHAYIRTRVLDAGRLSGAASEVNTAIRFLDHTSPVRIVVDGVRNPPPRVYVELAHRRGIPVDYIWHGPLTPQELKLDALGGDQRIEPMVTRCLTWGRVNEDWLKAIGARQPVSRVGCPLGDRYRLNSPLSCRPVSSSRAKPEEVNVLVLQYSPVPTDLRGLNANIYYNFAATVRLLRRMGYVNIQYKLHPGPGLWPKSRFERIARAFSLSCKIHKAKPFAECVDWADIVIGPALSGAFFETLASGKPYYPLLLSPHSMNTNYFEPSPILQSINDLESALRHPPANDAAGRTLLDNLYSTDSIPDPSARFWQAVADPGSA